MGYLNATWASDGLTPEEACRVVLTYPQLEQLAGATGRKSRSNATRTLREWCANVTATVTESNGNRTRTVQIEWPKFSEFQRYPGQTPDITRPEEGESEDAPAPAPEEKNKSHASEGRAASAPEGKGKKEPSAAAVKFAGRFRKSLATCHEQWKPPSDAAFRTWCVEADRMFRIDGRAKLATEGLAKWLFHDESEDAKFWRGNVLSVPKFRKHFDAMLARRAHPTERKSRDQQKLDAEAEADAVIRKHREER